jgi:hypothetical protein
MKNKGGMRFFKHGWTPAFAKSYGAASGLMRIFWKEWDEFLAANELCAARSSTDGGDCVTDIYPGLAPGATNMPPLWGYSTSCFNFNNHIGIN